MTEQAEAVKVEIRRIASELETFPYVARTWNYLGHEHGWKGNAAGGHYDIVAGCGGAAVYHDIIAEGGHGTRSYVRHVADRLISGAALRGRGERETAVAIEQVAFLRVTDSSMVSSPELPPDAGLYYTPLPILPDRRRVQVMATGAAVIGLKVARYMQQHERKPFGPRGIAWIVEHARASWRAAQKEAGIEADA